MQQSLPSHRSGVSSATTLSLLFGLIALHTLGIVYGWYLIYGWFSSVLHFLGGITAASLALWAWDRYVRIGLGGINPVALFLITLSAVALVGVVWEFFEFALDAGLFGTPHIISQPSVADTIGDLAIDLVGGAVFFGVARLQSKRGVR